MIINGFSDVMKNAIKPGKYIHVVCGTYAKYVLPERAHNEYLTNPPSDKQIALLHKFGFLYTRGLSKRQASELISIAIERDKKHLALPWQLQIITKDSKYDMATIHEKYANLTKSEAWQIIKSI